MSNAIRKLETVPAKDDKGNYVHATDAGFRLSVLNYKTNKTTKVKKPSAAYVVPVLYVATTDSPAERMVADVIQDLQDDYLREYDAGELSVIPMITDYVALSQDYWKDGRGNKNGIKQSVLVKYINEELAVYLLGRITASMPTAIEATRVQLVASLIRQFTIAATRNNSMTEKTAKVSCTLPILNDIRQRIETYTADENNKLESCEELDALTKRIKAHIASTEASMAAVTVAQF